MKRHLVTSDTRSFTAVERDILVFSHVIEKGLCHHSFRTRFGAESVKKLVALLQECKLQKKTDGFAYRVGIESLLAYSEANMNNGEDVGDLVPNSLINEGKGDVAGCYTVSAREYFSSIPQFAPIAHSRHSMRLFDCESKPIPKSKITRAVGTATTAPSACNRQSVRVYAIFNPATIARVAKIQRGCSGFGEDAAALIVVTSDLAMYLAEERRLPYVDGGIFCMNLLYALQDERLGACILNGSLPPESESEMRDILQISESQVVIAVLVVSDPSDETLLSFTKAPRRDVSHILNIVE